MLKNRFSGARLKRKQLDLNARSGYSLSGSKPVTHLDKAAEYYLFDWEYAQTPEQSSWIASAIVSLENELVVIFVLRWFENNNRTFNTDQGGFSEDSLLCVDPRGFKTIVQAEAEEFLKPSQVQLSTVVRSIHYSQNGVSVVTSDGRIFEADYALATFSVGVLQHDDVVFEPELPDWKQEAIQSINMVSVLNMPD